MNEKTRLEWEGRKEELTRERTRGHRGGKWNRIKRYYSFLEDNIRDIVRDMVGEEIMIAYEAGYKEGYEEGNEEGLRECDAIEGF